MFADVAIDEERVHQQWLEPGVPPGIAEGARAMDTLHAFGPNLDGPASMRAASCQLQREDEGGINVVEESTAATEDVEAAAAEHSAPSNDSPVCDESGLPGDLSTEFLIGVQECDV